MNNKIRTNSLLAKLIADLPEDPKKVKIVKQLSVREAIIDLRQHVGKKVFTKRQLRELVEVAYPELTPVKMSNLEASINRAKDYLECVHKGEQNIYSFKKQINN